MKQLIFTCILFVCAIGLRAQKIEYQVQFQGIGDNREFTHEYNFPQTILGERTSIELGTTVDSLHRFRVGINHFYEFGSQPDGIKPSLTAYYRYQDKQNTFYFGAFPRLDLIDFPLAMITDTFLYYRPNIEGLYGKHSWSWGHQLGFIDWTSRQTMTERETFLAGTSGELRFGQFYFQNYFNLFHYSLTADETAGNHITDNMGAALYLGYDFAKLTGLRQAYLKGGLLTSAIRQRGVDDSYITGNSFSGQLYGEGKRFALRSTFSFGDGHQFMNGDRYYQQKSYVRTDVIWKFLEHKQLQGTFNLSFHLVDGSTLDQQQQLSLIYRFGNAD